MVFLHRKNKSRPNGQLFVGRSIVEVCSMTVIVVLVRNYNNMRKSDMQISAEIN